MSNKTTGFVSRRMQKSISVALPDGPFCTTPPKDRLFVFLIAGKK
jgi:hypothetical protein